MTSSQVTASFESYDPARKGWSACFAGPKAILRARTFDEVCRVVRTADDAAHDGKWVLLVLSYEAAPAFDPAFDVHSLSEFPLAWAAIFDEPLPDPPVVRTGNYEISPWSPLISRDEYDAAIQRIRDYIAAGDTYQVNYTFPMRARFRGDDFAWYRALCAAQRAAYCAWINMGRYRILSISPELFFEMSGSRLVARPMKGTIRRGRWLEEDDELAQELHNSPKNRAENTMIVDLLRNDLGRIAKMGSVHVPKVFEIERYETVLQMTSTVEATRRESATVADVLRALFPCGSITGAPKIRTMQIIRELEPYPRQVYTGTIGLIQPGGDCTFNVAIRTVTLDTTTGDATFGVGGGITYDSSTQAEYDECVIKAQFLNERRPDFELLESLLLEDGEFFLLNLHVSRMKASAEYFRFCWDMSAIESALESVRIEHPRGCWKVRLLVSLDGRARAEATEIRYSPRKPRRVAVARAPVHSTNPFLYHKTTHRAVYEAALRERPDCDDIILWNERDEITESCYANVVVQLGGKRYTPARTCGLLAGTFREALLRSGEIRERVIRKEDLRRASNVWLINSVRKWMDVKIVD